MTLSATTLKQVQATVNAHGLVALLELTHASWAQPIRIAGDTANVVHGGHTYTATGFDFTLPPQVAGQPSPAQVRIANVGREIMAELEALSPSASVDATLRIVSRASPATAEIEFVGEMQSVQASTTVLTATITHSSKGQRSAVPLRYDPITAPGLFAA